MTDPKDCIELVRMLIWCRYNVPEGTKTLALVVEDIDAPDPSGPLVPWTVWVVVDIPPEMKGLPEGYSGNEDQTTGIREGNNDHKIPGWRGPLLPSHGHRFQFKLFALDDKPKIGHTVLHRFIIFLSDLNDM